MVKVKVKFYANLKERYCPETKNGIIEFVLEDQCRIQDLFERLKVDDREIGFLMLNGQKVQKGTTLRDGDLIHVFSFVAGG